MIRVVKTALVVVALTASTCAIAGPASAATTYGNCTLLHHAYKYGVARSDAAATRQARTGHYKPAVRPNVYAANASKDRDRDGTACEVTR